MVDVPFRPMNDHFVTILVFFAVFVGRRVPFFGHSLLSYSKRRHLSTSRVIPRPLSYHPYHMMTSYDTASICQSMLVENDVRMGVPFWVHKELSKSYREGTAQKLKSMALPYKTKVRKKMTQILTFGLF